jgi:HTH-type transcriptional regulator/antitoxin HigA
MKYKIISSEAQYDEYCKILEDLVFKTSISPQVQDEIDLLALFVEKWDDAHNIFNELDPVALLRALMKDHQMRSVGLANKLSVSPGLISDIINYKKGFSKVMVHRLAELFKVSEEAFNRAYKLKSPINAHLKNASVMNTKKKLKAA